MPEPTPAAAIDPETTWRESPSMAIRGTGDGYTITAYDNGFTLKIGHRTYDCNGLASRESAITEARDIRRLVMGVPRG